MSVVNYARTLQKVILNIGPRCYHRWVTTASVALRIRDSKQNFRCRLWCGLLTPVHYQYSTEGNTSKAKQVPADLVDKLERLALVDFPNQEGLVCLKKAIRFADQLHVVDTEGVDPMDSVLENRALYLREDVVAEGDCADRLLQLSKDTVEEYFVAPPGNIPLPGREEC
uniref:Glutamyl-tRNA(Gln) amidotransferase subunit C, mitochondrial n=1 Tax=Esox lucius TaxID=8010 RepID=A0AAY5L882_ESOLU